MHVGGKEVAAAVQEAAPAASPTVLQVQIADAVFALKDAGSIPKVTKPSGADLCS